MDDVSTTDETTEEVGGTEESSAEVVESRPYGAAALDPGLNRLTDLIPSRGLSVFALALAGLAGVAGVITLYTSVYHRPGLLVPVDAMQALNPAVRGSLADWYGSVLLALAALGSWLVLAVRRHRSDDYRGSYRIWIWASLGLGWASLDAVTRIHETLQVVMVEWTGRTVYGDGSVWWMGIYGLVLGALALRMTVEVRRCFLACLSLLLAGGSYAASAGLQLQLFSLDGSILEQVALTGSMLLGHGFLLLTVTLYARYVLLEAQGLRTRRQADRRPAQADEGDGSEKEEATESAKPRRSTRSKKTRVDASHEPEQTSRRSRSKSTASKTASEDEDQVDEAPAKAKAKSRKLPAKTETNASSSRRSKAVDAEETGAAARQSESAPVSSGSSSVSDELEALEGREDLSKAERRRLRKLKRRHQQEAA